MQLRLACNSPHNFYWPWQSTSNDEEDPIPDSSLITSSGKLLLLDRLVPYLLSRGHKLLIFSQFQTTLDILYSWAAELHDWSTCRIDGSTAQSDRLSQIQSFNQDESTQIFLLSTRAGGQGINLASADTVILFDSDWNPQQDLQAQDRAHRIGQKRPVIVYRLATRGTVEQTLLERADGKRRLEKLVIRKGRFRSLKDGPGSRGKRKSAMGGEEEEEGDEGEDDDDMAELARLLETGDGEGVDLSAEGQGAGLLSDKDLAVLTDRSDEAYARASRGEDMGDRFRAVETVQDQGVLAAVGRQ